MSTFQMDQNNEEVLLSKDKQQVMMEWEKPYMEASIDMLKPKGDVLEIGFGLGYSASRIMKYIPKSYTIIECDPVVLLRVKEWAQGYRDIPINIVEGTWQEKLRTLDRFDEIYFDDYPLEVDSDTPQMIMALSRKRVMLFLDLCIRRHTRLGSRISFYLSGNGPINFSSDTEPFISYTTKTLNIKIPAECKYRIIEEQKCIIPLVTKIANYDGRVAQEFAWRQISLRL